MKHSDSQTNPEYGHRKLLFWVGLIVLALMLTGCPPTSPMQVRGEIEPEPIVGQIFNLRIEAVSEQFEDEGVITFQLSDEINVVSFGPDWEEKPIVNREGEVVGNYLEWHGYFVVDEPQVAEVSLCVTKPGYSAINLSAGVGNIAFASAKLHINSTGDSAEVLNSRQYSRAVRANSPPAPTPEPVTVSSECSGEK